MTLLFDFVVHVDIYYTLTLILIFGHVVTKSQWLEHLRPYETNLTISSMHAFTRPLALFAGHAKINTS
jgi:hypothetical protein